LVYRKNEMFIFSQDLHILRMKISCFIV